MIVWCFSDNESARVFYTDLGGQIVETKTVTIGDEQYQEVGFYYDLKMINENVF